MRTRAAVAVLIAAAGLTACGGSSSSNSSGGSVAAPPQSSAAAESTAPAASAASTAAQITIAGFAFSPSPLTVAAGTEVSATNHDSAPHTVTSDTQGLFTTQGINQGQTMTFKAPTKPGTYTYNCAYHSKMHGTLVVSG
jgi:plastocyanin